MSDDLQKLMKKMKSNKKEEEKTEPVEEDVKKLKEVKASDEEIKKAVVDAPEELDDDEDEEEDDEVETSDPIPATKESPEAEDSPEHTVEAEIGLLQNDGMFRRELILVLKELVDVHKINTQALLDLKQIAGGDDGKKD